MVKGKLVTKPELLPLTSLRGFAALWVALTHISMGALNEYLPEFNEKTNFGFFYYFISSGAYAVDIFFILSGFIMCYAYKDKLLGNYTKQTLYNFYIARIARLWPLVAFTTTLFLVAYIGFDWSHERDMSLWNFAASFIFLDLIFGTDGAVNQPAWSIGAEFFSYLLFPLFLFIFKYNVKIIYPIAMICALSALYAYLHVIYEANMSQTWLFVLFRASLGFFIGCLLYYIFEKVKEFKYADGYTVCILAATIFMLCFFPLPYFVYPLLPWAILLLTLCKSDTKQFFSAAPFVYLGQISFSIYLVHYPVIELLEAFYGEQLNVLSPQADQTSIQIHLLVIMTGVIALSAMTYHFIELPGRKFIRHKFSR